MAHKYKKPSDEGGWAVEFGDADIVDVTDGVCDERTFADYGYGYRFSRVYTDINVKARLREYHILTFSGKFTQPRLWFFLMSANKDF